MLRTKIITKHNFCIAHNTSTDAVGTRVCEYSPIMVKVSDPALAALPAAASIGTAR